jgi:hypothetical protein
VLFRSAKNRAMESNKQIVLMVIIFFIPQIN